jgi:restriction system protein
MLSESEKSEALKSGAKIYKNRIAWALIYLKKAGLIESPRRAVYNITDLGLSVLKDKPKSIDNNFLSQFSGFCEFTNKNGKKKEDNAVFISKNESPTELIEKTYNTILKSLEERVLFEIMNQTSDFFEKLVVDLLVKMGYGGSKIENSQVIGKSGDEGIDGIIKEDKLGFDKIYIQAKQWDITRTVSRPELQKFVGALTGKGANKGAFITTASFTKGAVEYVEKQHTCKIVLIDGQKLAELMIEHNLGVSVEETYYIKRIDSDYFNDDSY